MPPTIKRLEFITVREASGKTGLGESQIKYLCRSGKIAAEHRGRAWWIDEYSALAWVAVEPNTAHRRRGRRKKP